MTLETRICTTLQSYGALTDAQLAEKLKAPKASVRRARGALVKENRIVLLRAKPEKLWAFFTSPEARVDGTP